MAVLLSLLFAVLLGLALAFAFFQFLFVKQEPNNLPHGSMGWPLCGETLGFLKPHKSNSIGSFLEDHCSRYGKVFKSHLFGSPTIVSCDHELNMFILQNEEKLFRCSYPKPIHGILGSLCLLVVFGDVHKKLRSVGISLISACKSKPECLHDINKLVMSTMESWRERKEVVFCEEARKLTLKLIVKQILNMEPEDPLTTKILEDYLTFMKGLVSVPVYIPGTPYAKAVKARSRIFSTIKLIINERRKRVVGLGKRDCLDILLSNASLSDEIRASIVLDILLGGYETTSTLLAMVVYFLGYSPGALEQLKEEHQAIRRRKDEGELLNWEDYKQMGFTHNVINEGLRCGNVVKFLHRKALRDVNFKGYFIPSGWKVLPIISAGHLDPSFHEKPSVFNPWRWNNQATGKHVTPFGGGSRLCPGGELAKVEIAFFLHHLVLNYRWRSKAEDHPMAYPYVEFTGGLTLVIEPMHTRAERRL